MLMLDKIHTNHHWSVAETAHCSCSHLPTMSTTLQKFTRSPKEQVCQLSAFQSTHLSRARIPFALVQIQHRQPQKPKPTNQTNQKTKPKQTRQKNSPNRPTNQKNPTEKHKLCRISQVSLNLFFQGSHPSNE